MDSVIVKMTSPEIDGQEAKELHHVTEAGAVLYNETYTDSEGDQRQFTTTVKDALDRAKILIQNGEPDGPCFWAQPVDE